MTLVLSITDIFQLLYEALKSQYMPVSGSNVAFGSTRLKNESKASIQSLPNELLFAIFSFLELKPYIICNGVCKKWQRLLPSTQMHPIRRRLIDLYRRILDTPGFEKTLEGTNKNIQPFDREEYIRCLLTQYPAIPEEFRIWILEWPARLVIRCIWPGLTFIGCMAATRLVRREGMNWIAYRSFSLQLLSLLYLRKTASHTFIPGLFIWSHATDTDWLVFDQEEPRLFGRVFNVSGAYHSSGIIPDYPHHKDVGHNLDDEDDEETDIDSDGEDYVATYADWISYLERHWSRTAAEILHPSKIYFYPDYEIVQPVPYVFDRSGGGILPAPRWDSSERTIDR